MTIHFRTTVTYITYVRLHSLNDSGCAGGPEDFQSSLIYTWLFGDFSIFGGWCINCNSRSFTKIHTVLSPFAICFIDLQYFASLLINCFIELHSMFDVAPTHTPDTAWSRCSHQHYMTAFFSCIRCSFLYNSLLLKRTGWLVTNFSSSAGKR